MDFIMMRKMCEQQGELSRLYMEQQKEKDKLMKEKYKSFKCAICNKRRTIVGYSDENKICCDKCV